MLGKFQNVGKIPQKYEYIDLIPEKNHERKKMVYNC